MRFPKHPNAHEVLVDPHVHSNFSDGLSSPRRLFIHAKRRGLRGVIVTDHDTVKHWDQCLEFAHLTGLVTALGVEISTRQGHLLAYFPCDAPARKIARALKLDQGAIRYEDVRWAIRHVHALGGVACVPHPFGVLYPLGECCLDEADGIEEYNSWIFHDSKRSRNAFGYARRHGIAALGGSDSHYPYTLGFGATAVPAAVDFSKPDWFLHCVRQRLTRAIVQQKAYHRRINFLKSTVSVPLNMRYNARFLRSKWRGYWRQKYRDLLERRRKGKVPGEAGGFGRL